MCGIAGYFRLSEPGPHEYDLIRRMVGAIRHRGPDEFGAYFNDYCGLGQARLSIIDLAGGSQPLANENKTVWITFNGEIFNYLELREELVKAGHSFRTRSDTEVIVHAYEEWGRDCLSRFNGQFAFVICDTARRRLFAARDRLGIRPLFYSAHEDVIYFASEIKSIFCQPTVPRRIDPIGLDQIFTWWTTAPPRTAFEGISELPPGHALEVIDGTLTITPYWRLDFPVEFDFNRSLASWAEELHALLVDSVRLRLRADVPVGAYLSGGLDSSATTALVRHFTDTPVETFSIAFQDKTFDESGYQQQMADHLGTRHHQIKCNYSDIAASFPQVIWHTERPIVRTAPTPLLLLSGLVRKNNFKVVLTGEGADEMLGGYDIFKETMIRRFWARNPQSTWRPMLLRRLYPTLPLSPARARFYLETFYRRGLLDFDRYYYSHQQRITTTTRLKDFYSDPFGGQAGAADSINAFRDFLPESFSSWHHLCRAQFLEANSLLSGYLLSSQGDRVAAAHAVEGRYPFLDHRVAELAARIPPWYKLMGLKEKQVLKKAMAEELPREIVERVKQPYMAPDSNSFFKPGTPDYVESLLGTDCLRKAGIFNPEAVQGLRAKCARLSHAHLSFKDNMSFIGVLSTQLLWSQYVEEFQPAAALPESDFKVWITETRAPH